MSEYFAEDFDGYEEEAPQPQVVGPKALREMHERDQAALREALDEIRSLREERRAEKVGKFVESKELDPGVVGLIPQGEKDPVGWLEKNLGLLAKRKPVEEPKATEESGEEPEMIGTVPAEEQVALGEMVRGAAGAKPKTGLDAMDAKIKSFTDQKELIAWLKTQK